MSNPKPNDVINSHVGSHNSRNTDVNLHLNNDQHQLAMRNIFQPPRFNYQGHQHLNSIIQLSNQLAYGNYLKNLEISANLYNRHVLSLFNRQQSQLFFEQNKQQFSNLSLYKRNQTQDPANIIQQYPVNIVQQNPVNIVQQNLMQNSNGK